MTSDPQKLVSFESTTLKMLLLYGGGPLLGGIFAGFFKHLNTRAQRSIEGAAKMKEEITHVKNVHAFHHEGASHFGKEIHGD
jgi:putative methionine-R-sulfoxide reductase with GAF domain